MTPVNVHQRLTRNQAKPNKKRSGRIYQKTVKTLNSRQPRFLKNVISVHPTVQTWIHSECHHSPKTITVLRKQIGKSRLIALRRQNKQFVLRF
jgi:hypothetical protein